MPAVAREGDTTTTGDSLQSGLDTTVLINGMAVAVATSVTADGATVTEGSSTVLINGLPIARVSDPLDDGSSIATGSDDVIVD